jgi:hypothetical protein
MDALAVLTGAVERWIAGSSPAMTVLFFWNGIV